MTKSLEQAIELMQKLPEDRQDLLARFVMQEISEDERWTNTTNAHADKLSGLVSKILTDDENGLCEPLDPEKL